MLNTYEQAVHYQLTPRFALVDLAATSPSAIAPMPVALSWLESIIRMKGIPQMKVRLAGLFALCCALTLVASFLNSPESQSTKASSDALSQAEQDLLKEINLARANPNVYATYLEGLKPLFSGKLYTRPGHGALTTEEGWSAVEEAIKFLRAAKPQGPFNVSNGLRLAALAHCADQSGIGTTGHKGGGGLIEDRVKPFGRWQGAIGENLSYGDESARERVLTWLIDDGVASRGHRKRLLSADYRVAGVACTSHPEFGKMCALTLAGSFVDSAAAKPATSNQNKSTGKTNTNKSKTNTNKSKTTGKPPSL